MQAALVAYLLGACGRVGYDLLPGSHPDGQAQSDSAGHPAGEAGGPDVRVEPGTERSLAELLDLPPPTRVTDVLRQGTQVTVVDGSGLRVGDEVLLLVQQAPGMLPEDVGFYTLAVVDAQSGDNLTLTGGHDAAALAAIDPGRQALWLYPVGAVGILTVSGRLTTAAWSEQGGGVLAVRAEAIVIEAGGVIDVSGLGYRGGGALPSLPDANGESYDGFVGASGENGVHGAGAEPTGPGGSFGVRGGGGAGARDNDPFFEEGGGGGGGGHGGGGGGGGGGANILAPNARRAGRWIECAFRHGRVR